MGSHTSTGEWQSFEARMRRRRAERLASRADAAAAAGRRDEARECLEEARELAPALPEFARIEAQLCLPVRRRSVPLWTTAGAGALLLLVGAMFSGAAGPVPIQATREFRGRSPLVGVQPVGARATPSSLSPPAPPTPIEATAPARAAERTSADNRATHPVVERPITRTAAPRAVPAMLPGPPAEPAALSEVMGSTAPVAAVTPPLASPESAAPVAAVVRPADGNDSQAALVRNALDRYAAAYSALDAAAAQRVWPRVNRAALTRAFDTLASQRLSLDACRVEVAGAAARASCSGSATWAPKVGNGGARTDPRQWEFELAQTGSGWQIVNARVQNK